ncbi:MAG: efflux RND transporter permease subunit [Kiritimatiellales bacterium]|nr:efflux RND transporter permease subunit [Kiritimatiellales bacterium]
MSNSIARIARFFLINRQLSLLLIITIFLFGGLAFLNTPKQYNPEITMPVFRITTQSPGYTAEEVETLITNEIENKIAEVTGIDETFSQSLPGLSMVTVIFKVGENLSESWTKVYDKMRSNMNLAPLGVQMPLIQQIDPEQVPIMNIAITSEAYPIEGLRKFAMDLRNELITLSGVSQVDIVGGHIRELRIEPDPERLAARNVTIEDIAQAIASQNIIAYPGELEGDIRTTPIMVEGAITNAEDLKRLVIRATADARVELEDVATIIDGYDSIQSIVRFRDKENTNTNAVYLSLAKRKGENGVTVSKAISKRLEELQERFIPPDIHLEVVRDEGRTAQEAIWGLLSNLIISIVIVTILLMIFLRTRAALVVAISIPLTLAIVLITGYAAGQTINRITLFALILSLGMLVDAAIVVVENIERHLIRDKEKLSQSDAASKAVGEVGMGLVLSTLTSVIVFLPMKAVTGMMGAYMGPLAFFVPVALLASLFVAITLTPYLARVLLSESDAQTDSRTRTMDVRYRTFIQKVLKDKKLQNRILLGTLIATVIAFSFPVLEVIRFRMLPKADREQFYVYMDAPQGTPVSETDALAKRIEDAILSDPAVRSLQTTIATAPVMDFNGLFKGADHRNSTFQATIKANLTHPSDRFAQSETIVQRIRPLVQTALKDEPDVQWILVEDPPGPPVQATLLARIKGPDPELRDAIARDLYAAFRTTTGVEDTSTTLPSGALQRVIDIDHAKIAHSGISTQQVITTLRAATSGIPAAIAHLQEKEQTHIVIRFPKEARSDIGDLSRIMIRNTAGDMVPLLSVADIRDDSAPTPIWHDERERTTMVMGEISANRPVVYAVKDLFKILLRYNLPNERGELEHWNLFGLTYRDSISHELYRIEWGGEFEMTLENFRDLGMAMAIAFFLVYVLLVAQFSSFRVPLLVMSSIIMGFAGVILGFAVLNLFGIFFSATSMIGAIALGGIVVNNAIILLEFIQAKLKDGFTHEMAIIEATQTRLRPIVLTSLTTVLGSLTIVTDPVWSGLAWAIVFGLSLSTVLTLVIFPILYYRMEST